MMNASLWWWVLVCTPLLAAMVVVAWPKGNIQPWLWLTCLPALVTAAWPPAAIPMEFLWPEARWGGDDSVTRSWLAFTAFLWACATAFAVGSLHKDPHRVRFWVFWLLALTGNLLLIIAQDGLSFYVGFTLMSLAAYGLVIHLGGPQPRRAGRLYLQLAVTGEFLVFAGLLMRAHAAGGSLEFAQWHNAPLDKLTLSLLIVGFGLKIGFWPLHVWLPLAHPAAPSPASTVLSGAMLKAGVLGLWRFLPEADPLLQDWAGAFLALGLLSAFYGVLLGLINLQAKAVLAYSSVSQMGYFLIILALGWRHPAQLPQLSVLLVLFAAHHALAKGALFMAAGVVTSGRLGNSHWRWAWWLLLALPALALAGLPLTTGAAAKSLLKDAVSHSDFTGWLTVLKLASSGTMLLLLRALLLLWQKQKSAPDSPVPLSLLLPWTLLCLASISLPWLWPTMREPLVYSLSLSGTWALTWPILLAAGLALLAIKLDWHLPPSVTHWRNPALHLSLRIKRLAQRPPMPALEPPFSKTRWRQRERRWNRFWQSGSVKLSAWLIVSLLVIQWLVFGGLGFG